MNLESTNLYHLSIDSINIITYQNSILDSLSLFATNKKIRELKFRSNIWKKYLEVHFPHFYANKKNEGGNDEFWFDALKSAYIHDYSRLSPKNRNFFSSIKQGIFIDPAQLKPKNLTRIQDEQGFSLSYWISRPYNQALADRLYSWIAEQYLSKNIKSIKFVFTWELFEGKNLLHWACILNQPLKIIESQLKFFSINCQDYHQETPLLHAVKNNHILVVQFLLEKRADVNLDTEDHWNPLSFAVAQHSIELIGILSKNIRRFSHPMLVAISHGYLDIYKDLLSKKGGFIGENDLFTAVRHDQYEIVEFLLNNNALVNRYNEGKCTALMIALLYNRTKIAELLIARGAKILMKNEYKKNALDIAQHRCSTLLPLLNRAAISEFITEWDRTHREAIIEAPSSKLLYLEPINSFFNGISKAKKRAAAELLKKVIKGEKEFSSLEHYPFKFDQSELGTIYRSFLEERCDKHHSETSSSAQTVVSLKNL